MAARGQGKGNVGSVSKQSAAPYDYSSVIRSPLKNLQRSLPYFTNPLERPGRGLPVVEFGGVGQQELGLAVHPTIHELNLATRV